MLRWLQKKQVSSSLCQPISGAERSQGVPSQSCDCDNVHIRIFRITQWREADDVLIHEPPAVARFRALVARKRCAQCTFAVRR
jgi:hypothetical protein